MILNIEDWSFEVDTKATWDHTTKNASDHCTCGYCKNFYDTVEFSYPGVIEFLQSFGVNHQGPSELMPFEPTLVLACYRVQGKILRWGYSQMDAGNVPVTVETGEDRTFLLWIGEMVLPWIQEEDMFDVVSPANLPEFVERMNQVLMQRYGTELNFS